jgi:hypothetical protein
VRVIRGRVTTHPPLLLSGVLHSSLIVVVVVRVVVGRVERQVVVLAGIGQWLAGVGVLMAPVTT